ncbi:hypothetical protein BHE74_00056311 [Ensete ventricosum]|nr:hypothetical protein BHE74_00056311 [Ensete ventricosum]
MAESPSLLFALLLSLVAAGTLPSSSLATRAFYVFGDSLVDNGNNNYLATTARADQPPYGIDTPPHLDGEKLLVGANFASAGIGILNDTGFQFVSLVSSRSRRGGIRFSGH